jgi:hypothetical protein
MQFLRIRQAETALAAGRLEEAFDLLADGDLRTGRAGQALLDQLIQRLLARARTHLTADRVRQALADCVRAEKLAGSQPEIGRLREQIESAVAGEQHQRGRAAQAAESAEQHARAGRVTLAREVLAGADDAQARAVHADLDARRAGAQAACNQAESALDRDDLPAAAEALAHGRRLHSSSDKLADLTDRLVTAVADRAARAVAQGRLDRLESLLDLLQGQAESHEQLADAAGLLRQCRRAARWVARGQFRRAGQALHLAARLADRPDWLAEAIARTRAAADAAEDLQAGPLGLLDPAGDPEPTAPPDPPRSAPAGKGKQALPGQFLLQVDSAGSFVVARGAEVTIGPISGADRPDVALMADATVPTVRLQRSEGDYVLTSNEPVTVNDRPLSQKVLADGDRIALSPRCVLRFALPNAASTTARIEVTSGRLPATGARTILLADREILMGPGGKNHICPAGLTGQAALVFRDGRMYCRSDQPLRVGKALVGKNHPIDLDTPVRLGPVGWVATRI